MTSGATHVLDLTRWAGTVHTCPGGWVIAGQDVPLDPILTVLLGPDVTVPVGALTACASHGVSVIVCDWRGEPVSATHPWSTNTEVGRRSAAQASLTRPRAKNAWMRLVKTKITNQAHVLAQHQHPAGAKRLREMARTVTSGDPRNVEAHAARFYWRMLLGDAFRRQPRSREGLNAALDYGYTVLRGTVLRETVAAGLNPTLGLRHHGPSNPFNLVDDLIEPFRPIVDAHVVTLAADALDSAAKHSLIDHVTTARLWPTASGLTATPAIARRFAQQSSTTTRWPPA